MFYELRRYEAMLGRRPALLDRFGSFTVPKWRERGWNVVGFWTPAMGGFSDQLIYVLGWESFEQRMKMFSTWRADPERAKKWEVTEKDGPLVRRVNNMLLEPTDYCQLDRGIPYGPDAAGRAPYLFELREYDAVPGKLSSLVQRFGTITTNYFKQYGFRQVGFWTPVMGGHNQQLIYMLAWENDEERARKFKEFRADPEREKAFHETERNGPLVERTHNTMLEPTAFSPMR